MKQQIIMLAKKTGNFLVKNSPHIFTGLAVVGVVGTIALVIKAQQEADEIVAGAESDRVANFESKIESEDGLSTVEFEPVTLKERFQMTWKCYIPAAVSTVGTVGFIIASDTVNTKRLTAISALYAASQKAIEEYKQAAKEVVGERTADKIRDKVAEKSIANIDPNDPLIPRCGNGRTLCFDSQSGRPFWSDANHIQAAVNEFNARLLVDYQMSLNEWYDYLGLDQIGLADYVGYKVDNRLAISFSSRLASNGTPCLVLIYDNEPTMTYRDW